MKTPTVKPFAQEMWDCVVISTAAIRSRRRRQEATSLLARTQHLSMLIRCARGFLCQDISSHCPLCSPPSPKWGRQSHRHPGDCRRHCMANTQLQREAWMEKATPSQKTNRGPQTPAQAQE